MNVLPTLHVGTGVLLELELQIVLSCHVVAGDQTPVLCKSSWDS